MPINFEVLTFEVSLSNSLYLMCTLTASIGNQGNGAVDTSSNQRTRDRDRIKPADLTDGHCGLIPNKWRTAVAISRSQCGLWGKIPIHRELYTKPPADPSKETGNRTKGWGLEITADFPRKGPVCTTSNFCVNLD